MEKCNEKLLKNSKIVHTDPCSIQKKEISPDELNAFFPFQNY